MNEAMKQSLSEKAVEILTQIQGAVASGAKLGAEQLPDIAQQFVQYTIISNIAWMLAGFIGLGVVYWLVQLTRKLMEKENEVCILTGIGVVVCIIFSIGNILFHIEPLVMALTAPKILIIKELLSVIK